ncbi:TetR/AcrR family transcriptional regulator [Paenibacillus sp. GCM10023250]|uniref:TetR/AcrR family transcriptional regulator n=1 Tax=Paenibacillus sp. GCM10023250 TaxID=3252648 RepID=UPI003608F24A
MGKRQDIMDATLDLIHEEGLQSVTLAKVLKKAKVGWGTTFNYFESKEVLINEVYKESRIHMGNYLMQNYNEHLTVYEKFKILQTNRINYGLEHPKEFLFIDLYSYSPLIPASLRDFDAAGSTNAVQSMILEGQKTGLIKSIDPHLCHQLIHGIIHSVVRGYLINKYPFDDLQIQQTIEASWKAIQQ